MHARSLFGMESQRISTSVCSRVLHCSQFHHIRRGNTVGIFHLSSEDVSGVFSWRQVRSWWPRQSRNSSTLKQLTNRWCPMWGSVVVLERETVMIGGWNNNLLISYAVHRARNLHYGCRATKTRCHPDHDTSTPVAVMLLDAAKFCIARLFINLKHTSYTSSYIHKDISIS